MINMKYLYNIYNHFYKNYIIFIISMKISQYLAKMWTNRPLGLNTNF